ncbi:MAG: DNA polymerase/3'-5' exonuclease PolX [Bacillota bacterium]
MKNADVCAIFRGMAEIMEILGEDAFRIRAYQRAAQSVESLSEDIEKIAARGELTRIPGIGKELARKIEEILATGTLQKYEELKKKVPSGLLELLKVPGIGPKTARLLSLEMGIKSIDVLERMALEGRLKEIPGIKAKTEQNILRGIALLRSARERRPLGIVLPFARLLVEVLEDQAPVQRASIAGSLRRGSETIGDIDILASSDEPDKVMDLFLGLPPVAEVVARGSTKASVRTRDGLQVDLRVVPDKSFGAALCYFTGSKAHNVRLRELGVRLGLKINEYGVFRGRKRVAGATEEEVFAAVGLPFIPPEMREDRGEIEAGLAGSLPRIVELEEIKGDLHVHSKYSDGSASLGEIAEKAKQMGHRWAAVCDHSQSLKVAGGLDLQTLERKRAAVEAFNARSGDLKLLCGAEVEIGMDGRLDYPDEVLASLDFVIAAIHTGFRQSEDIQTLRLLGAMRNPYVHAIAHPTGRLIGERGGYGVDLAAVFNTAAETATFLEINAYYKRLDLNDHLCRSAAEKGVRFSIGSDAHLLDQMDFIPLGVGVARRGWLGPEQVINTLGYGELLEALREKRRLFTR